MAKRNKEKTVSLDQLPVVDFEFPKNSGSGRAPVPSVYENKLLESYESQKARAIVYDGSEEQYDAIRRELERGARHLELGLRGPAAYTMDDGTHVVGFQCQPKRKYTPRGNGSESASEN